LLRRNRFPEVAADLEGVIPPQVRHVVDDLVVVLDRKRRSIRIGTDVHSCRSEIQQPYVRKLIEPRKRVIARRSRQAVPPIRNTRLIRQRRRKSVQQRVREQSRVQRLQLEELRQTDLPARDAGVDPASLIVSESTPVLSPVRLSEVDVCLNVVVVRKRRRRYVDEPYRNRTACYVDRIGARLRRSSGYELLHHPKICRR